MTMRHGTLLGFLGVLAVLAGQAAFRADAPSAKSATKVANFSLTNVTDKGQVSLADFKDKKAVVLLFLGTECPINNAFAPALAALHTEYAGKGVQFVGINSNTQDTVERITAHAKKHAIPFPVLKDVGNVVADQLGAQRTPEVFVLDADRVVRYRGRIDDQFGIGYQKGKPTRRDLAAALDEVLAGTVVSQPTTTAAGCLIGRVPKPKAEGSVTFAKEVSRILQKNCQECHRPNAIGPMALLSYDDALAWSGMIKEVLDEKRMPPWHADPRYGKFSNDRSLAKEDRETLLAWIVQDCPKGDDKDLPAPRQFAAGWSIDKPDLVLSMAEEFEVPAQMPKGGVPYKYFRVKTNFTEDKWVQMAEAKPGALEVVHHIVIFILPPEVKFDQRRGNAPVLCGTAPGDMPLKILPGMAKKVPAGSELIFQMHYTPNGRVTKDRSSVGLVFAKQPPERRVQTMPVGNPAFLIPAGDDNFEVESWFPFREDAKILSLMPHMHLRGKDFLYEVIYPDGKKETLLSVPRFDFNWQSVYRFKEPVAVPKGTKLHCVAHFDNSAKNFNNPDPAQDVRWGDQTWEEMMIGWTDFVYDVPIK